MIIEHLFIYDSFSVNAHIRKYNINTHLHTQLANAFDFYKYIYLILN